MKPHGCGPSDAESCRAPTANTGQSAYVEVNGTELSGYDHRHHRESASEMSQPFEGDYVEESSHIHGSAIGFTEKELADEQQHFHTVVSAFRFYRTDALRKITRQRQCFQALQKSQRDRLPNFMDHLNALRQCVNINYQFLEKVLVRTPFDDTFTAGEEQEMSQPEVPVSGFFMDKVHTTLRMFVRDWSREGLRERQQAYDPLIQAVERYFPPSECDVGEIQILNPGAGLGRLSWELAKRGYTSIGNEFSLYMLLASNFILNFCREIECFKIYPWIGHTSNNLTSANQMLGVSIPDVNPAEELPSGHSFGMVAGDFLEVFDRNPTWDCVPGGLWINLGPLLYHFSDSRREGCLELNYQQLKTVITSTGFEYLEENLEMPCTYVQNPFSMLQYEYQCIFFVCRKPLMEASLLSTDNISSAMV